MKKLLTVRNLKTYFYTSDGIVKAVDGISFNIEQGDIFGLVGESGCGKSVTALSIMRLIIDPPGKIVDGEVLFEGEDLMLKSKNEMADTRGDKISMIFQDPTSSLNPIMRVGDQIEESIKGIKKSSNRKKEVLKIMELVGIPKPSLRVNDYPFQFSGGMRQRIMIAIAIVCNPTLLIADEPTTNLDVTIQAQILDVIKYISESSGLSVLLITHNLGIIARMCDKIAVMYSGKIVEYADTETLFQNPKHPYTNALLECSPNIYQKVNRLNVIKGRVPNLINIPPGCRFYPRCDYANEICSKKEPQLIETSRGHWVSCLLLDKLKK